MSGLRRFAATVGEVLAPLLTPPPATNHFDPHQVTAAVMRYARTIGLDASNTVAAVAHALRVPCNTLECIRFGQRRADALRFRQQPTTPPATDRRA